MPSLKKLRLEANFLATYQRIGEISAECPSV